MRLAGSPPVIPTRFYNGKIDFDSLLRLLDHCLPELDGYTSRGALANPRRFGLRSELIEFATQNTPPGKPVVDGMTELARRTKDLGVTAGLVPCPYYLPKSFSMVLEFFKASRKLRAELE